MNPREKIHALSGHEKNEAFSRPPRAQPADSGFRRTAPVSVRRKSLGNQIADHLREEILLGRIAPGTTVSQQSLCDVYGTSRMPVRDALMKLSNEGLINSSGSISVVAQLTSENVMDSFDIEAMLHGRAGARAAARAADEEIEDLAKLDAEMMEAQSREDIEALGDLNWQFHRTINLMARSPKLINALRIVTLHVPRGYLTELPDWTTRANAEHAQIIEAFRSRDSVLVEELLHAHIAAAGVNLTRYLKGLGLFDQPKDTT